MGSNNILPFAPNNATMMTDDAYAADSGRLNGVAPGKARSDLANKTWAQAAKAAAGLSQFIADNQPADINDAMTVAAFAIATADAIRAVVAQPQQATTSIIGITRYATGQESLNPSIFDAALTPQGLAQGFASARLLEFNVNSFYRASYNRYQNPNSPKPWPDWTPGGQLRGGCQPLPAGLIFQWIVGEIYLTQGGTAPNILSVENRILFPTPFPTKAVAVLASIADDVQNPSSDHVTARIDPDNMASAFISEAYYGSDYASTPTSKGKASYFAIGY